MMRVGGVRWQALDAAKPSATPSGTTTSADPAPQPEPAAMGEWVRTVDAALAPGFCVVLRLVWLRDWRRRWRARERERERVGERPML